MIKIPRTTPAVPRPKLMRFSQCLRQRIAEEAEVKETAEKAKAPVSPPALARNPDR
jgi:hypothetical protein